MEDFRALIGRTVKASPQAKLNLRLKIVGRRQDGFHLLDMLNCEVSLRDKLEVSFEETAGVRMYSAEREPESGFFDPARNLAARAASAFIASSNAPFGVSINLSKGIPLGAGLGGGSSDAASVLLLLNNSLPEGRKLGPGVLDQLALKLGADVPYFLRGGFCRVSGIGERIGEIRGEYLRSRPVFIFLPSQPIATAELYEFYRRKFPKLHAVGVEENICDLDYSTLLGSLGNDFEQVLPEFAPDVWSELQRVRQIRELAAGLTGSGSAFFALPRDPKIDVNAMLETLRRDVLSPKTKVIAVQLLPSRTA
jgi:4-diphosphocytidyl-2-C-methyl-D-erythritol kinase